MPRTLNISLRMQDVTQHHYYYYVAGFLGEQVYTFDISAWINKFPAGRGGGNKGKKQKKQGKFD